MNIQIVLQARTGSTRFPNKVLKKIYSKSILEIIFYRLKKSKLINGILLITTNNPNDKILTKIAKKNKINYFLGSEENVLSRYYYASKQFKIDIIVRVTSDCPLLSSEIIDEGIKTFLSKKVDYLHNTNHKSYSFPDGFDIEIFNFKVLKESYYRTKNKTNIEHVTKYMRANKRYAKYQMKHKNRKLKAKYSLDTLKEFNKLEKIFEYFGNFDFNFKDLNTAKCSKFINTLK